MSGSSSTADSMLLVQRQDAVATLTLNRPAARNALSSALVRELQDAMRHLDADDDVAVIVLTGADPAFCAGLDLREISTGAADLMRLGSEREGYELASIWPRTRKPVIGAINGVAVTGGLELALHCDLLVASERAAFADTHAKVGILPTLGMPVLLSRAVGTALARSMSLTGRFLSAQEALRAGLVTAVVPHADLLDHAHDLAAGIAANHRGAVLALLETYRAIQRDVEESGLRTAADAVQRWLQDGFDLQQISARRASLTGSSGNHASG